MRRGSSGIVLGFSFLALFGCDSTDCALIAKPAVRVAVVDAASNEPLDVEPSGVIREGTFSEELTPGRFDEGGRVTELVGALERPGVYLVEVTAPGFSTWIKEGVGVSTDRCGVVTTELEAALQAQG